MRRSVLLVPVMAALLAGLVGCSDTTNGSAIPGTTLNSTPTTSDSTKPTTRSSSPDTTSGTASLRPCDLLATSEQGQFNLGEGVEKKVGRARSCLWQKSGSHTIAVGVFDDLGLKDVVSSGETKPLTVGRHKAVQYTGGASTCAIAVEVTESSRVDVSGVVVGDVEKGCEFANQAAKLVEPKLP